MKKLILALAMVGSLGAGALATSASAAPGAPMGVTSSETVTPVRMHRGEHRMHRRMHRRHHMRMHRNHMRHRMMHHRRMHRM
ncbi:hypothetical protein MBUL_01607 [Methylobacterium bullatum]|uniref:Uncharacterized protein n=1 Tax=Methylobacterium bullatum TaxID=570505 RepID=A0A679J318_9HYPH|nr:hypothetical protein [Methylobacterium sp. 10]KQP07028.1 hypothetical protein ASF26_07595 [Methylobacterium sp. Leaf93]CAA2102284.1 hypothetical protein MBUL_01607 [Methylobacterium bullatum]